ncbi:ROK family transcriptional regulator [Actinomycetes bacterium KLBMP 9797]
MTITNTRTRPTDFAGVRAANLAVVLRHVRSAGPCSRADIAAATGLNKATVSSLVADLIDRRLLRQAGPSGHRIGRPATLLMPDGQPYATIGIAVGSDHLTAVAVDLPGTRLVSWHRSVAGHAASPGKGVAVIAGLARRVAARVAADGRQVLGLTVGVPGLVDADGVVRRAPSIGWHDLDLRGELETALRKPGYPVAVDNDANLAVLAERRYGAYPETANLAFLIGGAGIGAGVVADGRLLRGSRGFSGEIGHIPVAPDGPPCRCGRRGCLEAMAGIPALIRRVLPDTDDGRALAAVEDGSNIRADLAPDVHEILRRARATEPTTVDALAETGRWLGHGAALLANLVDPTVVILGGYYAPLSPWLVPAAEAALAERTVAPRAGGCYIAPATLGTEAAALGAAARILDHIDAGHIPERHDQGVLHVALTT